MEIKEISNVSNIISKLDFTYFALVSDFVFRASDLKYLQIKQENDGYYYKQ